jgi:hypothetical protein
VASIGHRVWAIAEGWLPPRGGHRGRALQSHEAACVLNAAAADAHLGIWIFFEDREPLGPYRVTVAAQRTLHLRFDDLADPAPVPRGVAFASVIRSDVPVVIQHTRLDTRTADAALMTTVAFGAEGEST